MAAMRKIDKNLNLATAYAKWIAELEKEGKDHPRYTSSKLKFYNDIVGNLLWVQRGLCAYTEMFLMDPVRVAPEEWAEGKAPPFKTLGELDHYDSTLKGTKAWQWENFFMVQSDVNAKVKRDRPVNGILKPDADGYDPFYFLEYDFKKHLFAPCRERDKDMQDRILEDINILGLNYEPVKDCRRKELTKIKDAIYFEQITLEEAREALTQFYTAFEMSIQSLNAGE